MCFHVVWFFNKWHTLNRIFDWNSCMMCFSLIQFIQISWKAAQKHVSFVCVYQFLTSSSVYAASLQPQMFPADHRTAPSNCLCLRFENAFWIGARETHSPSAMSSNKFLIEFTKNFFHRIFSAFFLSSNFKHESVRQCGDCSNEQTK